METVCFLKTEHAISLGPSKLQSWALITDWWKFVFTQVAVRVRSALSVIVRNWHELRCPSDSTWFVRLWHPSPGVLLLSRKGEQPGDAGTILDDSPRNDANDAE